MLLISVPRPVPFREPVTRPARGPTMSQSDDTPALLWVNKDATNLHSKKHVAEVNAHVQKRGTRAQAKRSIRKSSTSSSRDSKVASVPPHKPLNKRLTMLKTRRRKSESPNVSSYASSPRQPLSKAQQDLLLDLAQSPRDRLSAPWQHSIDSRSRSPDDPSLYDSTSLCVISQLAHAEDHFHQRILDHSELPDAIPAHLSHLSSHDKMLLRAYHSYIPQSIYGPQASSVYCPIRCASITNISQDPVGLLWTLIALDMFLAKIRGDVEHSALILQRKDEAYRLMASQMNDPRDTKSLGFITVTASAAVAELFFGDSSSALMHLGAIDAVLQAQGGNSAIAQLPLRVSIPLLTAFAYRSLLQDTLLAATIFDAARSQFIGTMRSLLLQDQEMRSTSGDSNSLFLLPEEMALGDLSNATDGASQLRQCKRRAFAPNSVLHKFIEPEFECDKASDSVDHFLFLFNFNVALHDFIRNGDYEAATRFIDDLVLDTTIAQASGGTSLPLKISGARCLFLSRYAAASSGDSGESIARAWQAIDGLEILKLLSPDSRNVVYQTLSAMLTTTRSSIMTIEALESIDMESSTNWWTTTGLHELSAT